MIAWIALIIGLILLCGNLRRQQKLEFMWQRIVENRTSLRAQWDELEALVGRPLPGRRYLKDETETHPRAQ